MTSVNSVFLRRQVLGSFVVAAICGFSAAALPAQDILRRPLEHKDYDVWQTMSGSQTSSDGKWAAYAVQNGAIDGEATLHIHNTKTAREYVVQRGSGPRITRDSRFVIFRVTPEKKTVKELSKKKTKPEEMPKSKLQILELATGDVITVERVRSFKIPKENGDWIACLLEKPASAGSIDDKKSRVRESYEVTPQGLRRPAQRFKLKSREELARERGEIEAKEPEEKEKKEKGNKEQKSEDDADKKKKDKAEGTPLVLINLATGVSRTIPSVVSYELSEDGKTLAFATSVKVEDREDNGKGKGEGDSNATGKGDNQGEGKANDEDGGPADGVHLIQLDSLVMMTIAQGAGEYKNMAFSDDGSQLAFLTNKDDYTTKTATWAVYLWKSRSKVASKIAFEGVQGIENGWWVAPNSSQRFSEDGRRLYFETAPVPEEVVKEREAKAKGREVAEDDKQEQAKLDIWHWQDPQLQPQQLLQAARERNRKYRAAFVLKSKKILQLATRQAPIVNVDLSSSSNVAVANTNMKYRKMLSWDVPGFQDAWLVDLNTGQHKLVLEKVKWSASMSPEGRYITWFDAEQRKWYAKLTADVKAKPVEISKGIKYALHDELHDRPMLPGAYGSAGWMIDDSAFLVYDRYDIWRLDPTGKSKPVCMTDGFGRDQDIRFRYRRLDVEERAIDPAMPIMLSAFNRKTKASGFYVLNLRPNQGGAKKDNGDEERLQPLIMLDEALGSLQKAKDSDKVLFTRSTFRKCPDLWSSDTSFKKIHRVSDINPQQDEYTWGDAELVHWKGADGRDLDGILLKPDGFDPSKKYPMMVYFYERNSDNLHRYSTPAAGRSIICHSFYVSRGYLVFIPDIPYKTGEPGPSATNAVIPGVEHLIAQGFVNKAKIGTQGHSWGGYQTAFLVTQTDLFACAESGAPVSNMTSAYGGIRWGSGMSRMFQYERTQSRIGDDLWSARDKYLANSPLFFADKINTPLLILHNDEDGAVPWYQGIELFVALRRLEKPSWMLNYNGNPHWVMGEYNRRDFAIRMQQFFDHYLKASPEPEWMAAGVRAVDKGKNFGLELLEPETKKSEAGANDSQ